jgi:DNA invertase Pin-like site-specific DNA recombinase
MALSVAEAQARQIQAAVYLRISKDEDDNRLGVDRQRDDCVKECLARGWAPVVFTDNDVSASKGLKRPAYEQMLRGVTRGEFGAVVAHYADRLHRSPVELERFIDVVNAARVQVVTIKSGDYDLSTADGRMVARILGSVARGEVEKMAAKIARAKLQSAQAGKPSGGGRRPYGFEDDKITHRPDEADAIRDAAQATINGASLHSVAERMGKTTYVTKRILTSERVAGLRKAGTEVVPAVWEPIVDMETWQTVRSILLNPSRSNTGAGGGRRYLLSGLMVCWRCGEKLRSNPTQGKRRYACPNNHLLRLAEPLEEYVSAQVLAALESPAVAEGLRQHDQSDADTKTLADTVARYEANQRMLDREFLVERLISKAVYIAAKSELDAKITDARQALAARAGARMADTLPLGSQRIRKAWDKGTVAERRDLISVVVESIVVGHAGKGARVFDPDLIEIHWRAEL